MLRSTGGNGPEGRPGTPVGAGVIETLDEGSAGTDEDTCCELETAGR